MLKKSECTYCRASKKSHGLKDLQDSVNAKARQFSESLSPNLHLYSVHVFIHVLGNSWKIILILPRKYRLLNFPSATNFKLDLIQSHSQLVKILSDCQTAQIQVRRRVTRRLNRIDAVCKQDYGRDRQDKGKYIYMYKRKANSRFPYLVSANICVRL